MLGKRLSHYREYTDNYPFQGWLLAVVLLLLFDAVLLASIPGLRDFGQVLLCFYCSVGPPTLHLVHRFSKAQRARRPISPDQETAVSILALLIALFGFPLATPLALAIGAATRHKKLGAWGFGIAIAWTPLFVAMIWSAISFFLTRERVR